VRVTRLAIPLLWNAAKRVRFGQRADQHVGIAAQLRRADVAVTLMSPKPALAKYISGEDRDDPR